MLNEELKQKLNLLISNGKISLSKIGSVALPEAWKILQLATADVVQSIQLYYPNLKGTDKKTLAMEFISDFYDKIFTIINVPFVPQIFQPIIKKYVKALLMVLVGASIDALVTTFKNTGIFPITPTVDPLLDSKLKVSEK